MGSSLYPLLSGKDGVHAVTVSWTPPNACEMGAMWPLFHKPQTQERQRREKVPSVKPAMAVPRGDKETGACRVHRRAPHCSGGGTGAQQGFSCAGGGGAGGMGQGAPHPCAGPARVSAKAPARSPPQVRAGSERHLLDCSVRCRTTEVKAPRPCGERAARRKAYSVLGFRSSTTKAVAGSKVLATWGRGEERDPDGERARERGGETDRHRPTK